MLNKGAMGKKQAEETMMRGNSVPEKQFATLLEIQY